MKPAPAPGKEPEIRDWGSPSTRKTPGTRSWRRGLGPETGVPPPPCELTNKLKILPSPILWMQAVIKSS